MEIQSLLKAMWTDYCDLNPAAKRIYELFSAEGEIIQNDHIALRTFRHPRLGLETLAKPFKAMGYQEKKDYHFEQKKLYAKHYEHPSPSAPKIFISELLMDQFSDKAQSLLNGMIEQITPEQLADPAFSCVGRPWQCSYKTYTTLAAESEYAAWVAAIGFRPNHFTVFVNAMKTYDTLEKINQFLVKNGYPLNVSGGAIKGSKEELLEQSSTMAELIEVSFTDGQFKVPGCYYEFARRYKDAAGNLYQGFVAASADKIFESTDRSSVK